MKLRVLVSTHSTDTASTFIVPMRSVLVVTTRPLVGDGLMSRATAMPRRGSYRNVRTERSAVPPAERGVKASDTLAYVVMERRVDQPLGPLPEMFRDLPRETQMAVVMVMRRYGREWRSMLDGIGESVAFGPELLYEEE